MNNKTQGRTLAEAKRIIAQKSKEFEQRLLKSSNDFYTVLILTDMQEMIEAEIFSWSHIVSEAEKNDDADLDNIIDHASQHVSNMAELVAKINEQRKLLMPQALKIQQAMLNSHQLNSPKIQNEQL